MVIKNKTRTSHTISKEYIKQFLPPNPIIVEAGAHIGRDTIKMAKLWPEGYIYAFEPVPHLFEQLKHKTEGLNVSCFHYALSNETGTALFQQSGGISDAVSSLLEPNKNEWPPVTFASEPIEVKTITLDDWAEQNNITKIDFIWLDLQGAELQALKGAEKILSTISVIYTEVNLKQRYKDAPLYDEVKSFLEAHGFTLIKVAFNKKRWGNALFYKNS